MNLFDELCTHLNVKPDGHGEAWADCPQCGKPRKDKKFSFNERGAHCFVCNYSANLNALADKVGLKDQRPYTPPQRAQETPHAPRAWQADAELIVSSCESDPRIASVLERTGKPLKSETIAANRLGVGAFPGGLWFAGKWEDVAKLGKPRFVDENNTPHWVCTHDRLIVPIFDAAFVITGFRCRAFQCDCTKWLSPGGSVLQLYNVHAVRRGQPVVIVENPIDALLITERWYPAVATFGVSIWKDDYTAQLTALSPEIIISAYDNDAPGYTTDRRIIAAWIRQHKCAPPLNGLKLANRLCEAGLPAKPYVWPVGTPAKYDIGQMLNAA